jgi:hypothetical protein
MNDFSPVSSPIGKGSREGKAIEAGRPEDGDN